MNPPCLLRFRAVAAALCCLAAPGLLRGGNLYTPVVAKPPADITVAAGTDRMVVNMKKTFGLPVVGGPVVRFDTSLGNIDVELDSVDAPKTVANFLGYANSSSSTSSYNHSFIHRSVPGFIIQGGGYQIADDQATKLVAGAPVENEFKVSNLRGTIAMAKLGGDPDSATDEWFFNLADNSANLDAQNGGFTVFGRVIGDGLSVVDAIAALKVLNAGDPYSDLPVLPSYTDGTIQFSDLVYVNSVKTLSSDVAKQEASDMLVLTLKGNTNPALVTPTVKNKKLVLTFAPGQTGSSKITVITKVAGGGKAKAHFTVTVQ